MHVALCKLQVITTDALLGTSTSPVSWHFLNDFLSCHFPRYNVDVLVPWRKTRASVDPFVVLAYRQEGHSKNG